MFLHKSQSGFSLMELLIATVVLSIGILAVAGLQLKALRQNNGNYVRAQAILLAYDISDRIRANQIGALNGDYQKAVTDTGTDNTCDANTCSTNQLAAWDIFSWETELKNIKNIPLNGAGDIHCQNTPITPPLAPACSAGTPCTTGPFCQISVNWDESDPENPAANNINNGIFTKSISIDFRL
jgi:type IV pilus modification protein PilV